MNSKMTANPQLLTTTPKTKTKAKQTTRTGTDSQKWRSHGTLSVGSGDWERMRGKVQEIRTISDRYKIERGRLRIVWEMEKPKNLYV